MSKVIKKSIAIDVEDLSAECQAAIDHYTDLVQRLGPNHPTTKQAMLVIIHSLPEEAQWELVQRAHQEGLISLEVEIAEFLREAPYH